MAAAFLLAPAAGQAQAINCSQCRTFTLAVHPDMACAITVCYVTSPFTLPVCKTLDPGKEADFPCNVHEAWVQTCSGPFLLIPANNVALCSPELKFAIGCCGRICNVPSPTVCTRLEVQPRPCASLSCP